MAIFVKRTRRHEPFIDLRDAPAPVWGRATACPHCGGNGYLDHIDMVRRVMHQHCVVCARTWQTPQQATLVR